MARPSEYNPSFCKIAQKVTELGGTDQDVMDALGIAKTTFYRWRNEFEEFRNSLKVGKTPADERVEMSLYRRALGYSHEEDDIRAVNGEIVITPTIKHYPPDTTACIFWLKNRMPEKYRANPEAVEVDDGVTIKVIRATKNAD